MTKWEGDIPYDELNELALKLSKIFNNINDNLMKLSGIAREEVAESFIVAQSKMLGFDNMCQEEFRKELDEKNVLMLSQQNIFMTCILTSAVSLSIYKNQPKPLTGPRAWSNKLLQPASTNSIALMTFATASFYAVLGTATFKKLVDSRKLKKHTLRQKASVIGRVVKEIKGKYR